MRLSLTALPILLLTTILTTARAADHPNVVLIFVDDLGYGDLACYGNDNIKTPHLDQLAATGQRWTSFYAAGSTCVPSRTGLMSGRHPALLSGKGIASDPQALMPAMFKRQGYATAILGKWHLAGYPKDFTKSPMHPLECGFDFHYGTPGSNDVPAPRGRKQTRALFDEAGKFTFPVPLIRGREIVEFPTNQELFTKRYTEQAIRWITEQRDQNFFLYLAHNMPHAPIFASPEFQGKSAGGRFGDVVEEIDWSVGQIVAALEELDLADNTLVVFTSDNGPWTAFGPHGGTAKPLRGEKSTTWEGGQRVPAIFSWPGRIKPGIRSDIATNLDLYATFATLIDGQEPARRLGYESTDFSETLLQGKPSPRQQWLYGRSAFRSGNYKIHTSTKAPTNAETRQRSPVTRHNPPLLFDLSKDLSEHKNIASQHPDVVQRLLKEMATYQQQKAVR